MDFRSGKTDIMQIQKLLSGFIVGRHTDSKIVFGPKNYGNHERNAAGWNSLAASFFDNSIEIEAKDLDTKFHTDIPLLLQEEKVVRAFRQARDLFVYTNRRFLIIDTKCITGQRVKYKSIPYKFIHGIEFETAGHLDRDAEIFCHTSITKIISSGIPRAVGLLHTKQSILVKHTDIYEIGKLMSDYTIFDDQLPALVVEPEIEIHIS
jgi:hypothetical protein